MYEIFNDGDSCIIHLKNRSQEQNEEEEDWYEKAFGAKQNMMSITITYLPFSDLMKKGKSFDMFARIDFKIFDELKDEFSSEDYPPLKDILVNATLSKNEKLEDTCTYSVDMEYPYGEFTIEYFIAAKGKLPGDSEYEPKPLQDLEKDWNAYVKVNQEPVPKSIDQLKKEHMEEEEENKKREQEARMAQKRLEEEKARLRYEQQQ